MWPLVVVTRREAGQSSLTIQRDKVVCLRQDAPHRESPCALPSTLKQAAFVHAGHLAWLASYRQRPLPEGAPPKKWWSDTARNRSSKPRLSWALRHRHVFMDVMTASPACATHLVDSMHLLSQIACLPSGNDPLRFFMLFR